MNNEFQKASYLKQEGTFEGELKAIRKLKKADGYQLLVTLNNTDYVIPIFSNGWKYVSEVDDLGMRENGEKDIDILCRMLRPGHITFRMSMNYKSSNFYCRYIKDDKGNFSGFKEEAEFNSLIHPYPDFPFVGKTNITILSKTYMTDDFNHPMLKLIVCKDDIKSFSKYILMVPSTVKLFDTLHLMTNKNLKGKKWIVDTAERKGKVYADDITDMEGKLIPTELTSGKIKEPSLKKAKTYSYKNSSQIKQDYEVIPEQDTILKLQGKIIDDPRIDFRDTRNFFFPFLLSNNQKILMELNPQILSSKKTKDILASYPDRINLISNRKFLYPGCKFTVILSKSQKGGMVVRALFSDDSPTEIMYHCTKYNQDKLISDGIIPKSSPDLSSLPVPSLSKLFTQYYKLKSVDKYLFREKLEMDAMTDWTINLDDYNNPNS